MGEDANLDGPARGTGAYYRDKDMPGFDSAINSKRLKPPPQWTDRDKQV